VGAFSYQQEDSLGELRDQRSAPAIYFETKAHPSRWAGTEEETMAKPVKASFDYAVIEPELRRKLREASNRIRLRMGRLSQDAIDTGGDLVELKNALPHGQFLRLIDTELCMSESTARRFMAVYKRFGTKSVTVTGLPPKALYELAAASTPDDIVQAVMKRSAAGEIVTYLEIKAMKVEWLAKQPNPNIEPAKPPPTMAGAARPIAGSAAVNNPIGAAFNEATAMQRQEFIRRWSAEIGDIVKGLRKVGQ
jgi:Protein of unknown function (DUF3102)